MAAPMNADKLQEVANKSREEGRQCLQSLLGWPEFDEEEQPRKAIHLDCLHNCLCFMVQRGQAWSNISILMTLLQELLLECPGKTLPDTVKLYHLKIHALTGQLNDAALKLFTEYFFSSFLKHFKLYQFVFTRDQEMMRTVTELEVNVPEEPLPFPQAKDIKVYEYEQKYESLERQLEQKQEQHEECVEESRKSQQQRLAESLSDVEQLDTPLERQKLLELINSVAHSHVSMAAHDIKTEITFTMDELDLMLEKTALPRPSGLGAPPRYKTKTPVPTNNSKRQVTSRETLKSRQTSSRPGRK